MEGGWVKGGPEGVRAVQVIISYDWAEGQWLAGQEGQPHRHTYHCKASMRSSASRGCWVEGIIIKLKIKPALTFQK